MKNPALNYLYEDDDIFVINKPPCIHSVMVASSDELSIAELLLKAQPAQKTASRKEEDGGLVNRLDFETSGILVGAKSRPMWESLFSSLKDEKVQKTYLAIVEGKAPKNKTVSAFIGTPARRGKKVHVYIKKPSQKMRALPAESWFDRISFDEKANISLVRVKADAARRHQVRALAQHIGHPLVGDALYGSGRSIEEFINHRGGEVPAFFLHAETLSFTHPRTKKHLSIAAPLPSMAKAFLKSFRAD